MKYPPADWEVDTLGKSDNSKSDDCDLSKCLAALLWLWKCRASKASNAHFYASDYYSKRHGILTTLNVASAIMVLFLTNNRFFGDDVAIFVSIAGALTVITTALQYILNYRDASRDHKVVGNEYSNVKRKAERLIASGDFNPEAIHRMSNSLNWLGKSSPAVKRGIWDQSAARFRPSIDNLDIAERHLLNELAKFGFRFDDYEPGSANRD